MEAPQDHPTTQETKENEFIEESLDLLSMDESNIEKYVSHFRHLVSEGQGELFYEIGGEKSGISESDYDKMIANINTIIPRINCFMSTICERTGKNGKIGNILLRESSDETVCVDIRYCVCGNVDSGKSTMVGVLTRGQLDNGRGLMRLNCFAHKHEIVSGRTSSISQQIMGFDVQGQCVNQQLLEENQTHAYSWGDIMEKSFKVVSFIDLAGHEKYLRTTVSGMTGHMPDYCLLLVGANMGVTRMTREHIGLALALKIPLIVVITKIDMSPANILKETLTDIQKIFKMKIVNKIPIVVRSVDDLVTAVKSMNNDRVVPIFLLSNVTGENLDLFRKFLNVTPPRIQWELLRDKPSEVLIDQTYFVTGVGTVVGGTVMAGKVVSGQTMLLGPDANGVFIPVQIKSVHSKKIPVKEVVAGQSAGFALKKIKRSTIRKGMVLVDMSAKPVAIWAFEADVVVLSHSTTIHTNYQPVVQCLTIRQSAAITKIMEKEVLRTGDRDRVRFKFLYRPEYLKVGMRLLFREGRCKGLGIICKVMQQDDQPDPKDSKEKSSRQQPKETSTTSPAVNPKDDPLKKSAAIPNTNKPPKEAISLSSALNVPITIAVPDFNETTQTKDLSEIIAKSKKESVPTQKITPTPAVGAATTSKSPIQEKKQQPPTATEKPQEKKPTTTEKPPQKKEVPLSTDDKIQKTQPEKTTNTPTTEKPVSVTKTTNSPSVPLPDIHPVKEETPSQTSPPPPVIPTSPIVQSENEEKTEQPEEDQQPEVNIAEEEDQLEEAQEPQEEDNGPDTSDTSSTTDSTNRMRGGRNRGRARGRGRGRIRKRGKR